MITKIIALRFDTVGQPRYSSIQPRMVLADTRQSAMRVFACVYLTVKVGG